MILLCKDRPQDCEQIARPARWLAGDEHWRLFCLNGTYWFDANLIVVCRMDTGMRSFYNTGKPINNIADIFSARAQLFDARLQIARCSFVDAQPGLHCTMRREWHSTASPNTRPAAVAAAPGQPRYARQVPCAARRNHSSGRIISRLSPSISRRMGWKSAPRRIQASNDARWTRSVPVIDAIPGQPTPVGHDCSLV